MADGTKVAAFKLSRGAAAERIHELAEDTENVIWSDHALERMAERDIQDVVVLRVLRTGWVDSDPELTAGGEWKCKITLRVRGGRVAGVATIILHSGNLFVKTVEWEDRT